jgi:hypothetical protein
MHTIRAFAEAFPSARIDAVRALGGLPAMPMHAGRAFVLESIKGEARPANKVRRHHHHRAVCHGAQHSRALFVQ